MRIEIAWEYRIPAITRSHKTSVRTKQQAPIKRACRRATVTHPAVAFAGWIVTRRTVVPGK
jgi:hypothetical protein